MAQLERWDQSCLTNCAVGQALDGLCVGLVLTNRAEKVIWMNRAAARVFGVDPQAVAGASMRQLIVDPQLFELWSSSADATESTFAEVSVKLPKPFELKVNCTHWETGPESDRGRALLFCDVTQDRAVRVELTQAVAHRLLDLAGANGDSPAVHADLTVQERRVLSLLGRGMGNHDIAAELGVSPTTVRSHLKSAYRKLGVASRAEAVSYAVRHGLS